MRRERNTPPAGLVAIDFDGTLRPPDGRLSATDLEALAEAGRRGLVRALVSGRSQASLAEAMPPELEARLDYALLSCGAVSLDLRAGRHLELHSFSADEARGVEAVLRDEGLDFSRHAPAPDNHRFALLRLSGQENPDMDRREQGARGRGWLEAWRDEIFGPVGQFIAVLPPEAPQRHQDLRGRLPGCSVIRATSPVDHRSTWLEVFPPRVSKAAACDRLCERLGLDASRAVAVGNDHNDADMLAWAGAGYVVAGAPAELRARHETVAACDAGGVAQALNRFFASGEG